MPIRVCLFCREVKMTSLWFQVCDECSKAEADLYARMDQVIEEQGLQRPAGSLVYHPKDRKKHMEGLERLREVLEAPELTAAQAEKLFENPACTNSMNDAAWLFYSRDLSVRQVGEKQDCSASPVRRRLAHWRTRAKAMLDEGER